MDHKGLAEALFGALLSITAACGSDDGSTSETTGPTTTGAPATSLAPETTAVPTVPRTDAPTTEPATTAAVTVPFETPPPLTDPPDTEPATTEEPTELYHRDLEVGDCFDNPPNGDFSQPLAPVDCAAPHDFELFADGTIPLGEGEAFPDQDEMAGFVFDDTCNRSYEPFAGFIAGAAAIPFSVFTPDESDWANGDRRVLCVVTTPEGKLTGTLASAGLSAPNVQVVHVANLDGTVDLYLSQQGQEPVRLTSDDEEEQTFPPSVDVDARRGYYSRYALGETEQADIVSLDQATGEVTTILATLIDESAPQLSPDGTKIVYASNPDGEYDIWVMGVDGSNPTQLTTNPERDANPSWSPDGSQIVFRARQGDNSDIWVMNADGSGLTQLTDDPAGDFDPVFSPDGSTIVFTSDRSGNFDIWVMNADGSDPGNLTNHPATEDYPSWTDDGEGLTFTSDRLSQMIWIMRADGSEQTLFTTAGPSLHGTTLGSLG